MEYKQNFGNKLRLRLFIADKKGKLNAWWWFKKDNLENAWWLMKRIWFILLGKEGIIDSKNVFSKAQNYNH